MWANATMKRKQKHHTTTSMQNSHIFMALKNEDFQIENGVIPPIPTPNTDRRSHQNHLI